MRGRGSAAVLLAALVTGCAPGGGESAVQRTAEDFSAAVTAGDGRAACALLAPETRRQLERDAQQPCADGVLALDLPEVDRTARVVRRGHAGRVVLTGDGSERDTRLLALVGDRWRVTAAGCTPGGDDLPHDCDLEGP